MNELDKFNKKYGGSVTAPHRGRLVYYMHKNEETGETVDVPRQKGQEKYFIHTGGDASKNGYTDVYLDLFSHFKDESFNFLEIGIFQGRSLAMWSDYFKNATINGIDINTKEFYLTKPELEKMGAFTKGKLGMIKELNTTTMKLGGLLSCFRIIIDDGAHAAEAQWATFKNYFTFLCSGGIYVIEDVHQDWAEKFKNEMLKLRDNDEDSMSIFKVIKDIEVIECNKNARMVVIERY